MKHWKSSALAVLTLATGAELGLAQQAYSWRNYRPGNTGIQGDNNEAVWVAPDGDPYIGGYNPSWEEGGFAKFVQNEDRWVNFSNVDYPVIGNPNEVGCSRVTDFVPEPGGKVWVATWRGALRFDPAKGASSLVRFGPSNSQLANDLTYDMDRAPDGSIWFANQGIVRYDPATNAWTRWNLGNLTLSVQPKPTGGYLVWSSSTPPTQDYTFVFDSDTQQWTTYTVTGAANEVAGLPGKDCVDDTGNLWAIRTPTTPGDWNSVDYRRPDGTWVTPPEPYASLGFSVWAFKAYGDRRALAVDGAGEVWQFDGSNWNSLGVWRPGYYTYSVDIDAAGNVWVCGIGGAAKRDVVTGQWQRYRVTNTGNCDNFNGDLAIDPVNGYVYATANAAAGVGGMTRFDGERWVSWNQATYGLGYDWPFPNDNSQALANRPSNGNLAVSPTNWIYGVHEWTGSGFQALPGLNGAQALCEDSLGRLWALGEYFGLDYHDGSNWNSVGLTGWGLKLRKDPTRPGTIWATTDNEIKRTDGSYSFSRTPSDFPGSHGGFTGLAPDANGIVWVGTWTQFTATGSTLIRLDANTGAYTIYEHDLGWPFPGEHVRPLAVTPDGRLWLHYDSEYPSPELGLCWWDGVNVGTFPAPFGGVPQWGGLPHASINDFEVRPITGGYELWMSFGSRGIAVLTVLDQPVGTLFCAGDGSSVACPCGNQSAASAQAGCLNGTGAGAELRGLGTASVAADNLTISVAHMPSNSFGLVFMGANSANATPFGNGLRCIGLPIYRFALRNSASAGSFSYGPGQIDWIQTHLTSAAWITPGSTWRFQGWFRDSAGPCGAGFNVSNALEVNFTP